jgi:D-alanyl-lipoteichoic acid acyltransferase DltB (MBOAT superfamily)
MWWNPVYIFLLGGSILFNFQAASLISRAVEHKKMLLFFSVGTNLAFLGYFKYADFFLANVSALAGTDWQLLNIVLPLAISFFTLQQIAFLVDVYEGLVEEKSFRDYALFVSFFPQLIAGPIVHHSEVVPQFRKKDAGLLNDRNIALGLFIFSVGLFKKVIIADSMAPFVESGFDAEGTINATEAHMANLAYMVQVYFDFSGYSDMAVGLGLLFNIRLPINFNSPYKATNIIDFWQRWHITLTDFINTYIYIPLIRLRGTFSFWYSMCITVLVMAIVGLWHGAGWNFILFGTMHGFALAINHIWLRYKPESFHLPAPAAWLLTMFWFYLSLIPFRSDTPEKGWRMLEAMFGGNFGSLGENMHEQFPLVDILPNHLAIYGAGLVFALLFAAMLLLRNPHQHDESFAPNVRYFLLTAGGIVCSTLLMNRVVEFIYFQF